MRRGKASRPSERLVMSLIGSLVGGGGSSAPSPKPADQTPAAPPQSSGQQPAANGNTATARAGSQPVEPAESTAEPTASSPSSTATQAAAAPAQPTEVRAPAVRPVASRPVPQATPVDTPAVRFDFALEPPAQDDASARSYALAAQARERVDTLAASLAAPAKVPTIEVLDAAPAETASQAKTAEPGTSGASAFLDNVKTLRGTAEPVGAILDRAA